MNCEKCTTGTMFETKIPRLSGCLVAIGYTLLVPSVLILGITALGGVLGISATSELKTPPTDEQISRFEALGGMVPSVLIDFEDDGKVSQTNLSRLSPDSRQKAEALINEHAAFVSAGKGMLAFIGGFMTLIIYLIFLPGFIIGFLLVLKKKVWKCNSCGYIFDRA